MPNRSVLAWIGLLQLLIIPFVPKSMARIELRILITVGLSFFAGSCLMNVHMPSD
jgi:MFS transporter, DHA2 family, multidrug resistance protein